MNKFDKAFRKNVVENYYRLLSLADVTVNKAVLPISQKAFDYVQDQINIQLKQIDQKQSPRLFGLLEEQIQEGMKIGHKLAITPFESLGERLNDSVLDLELKLRDEYGINTNQWLFSKENLEIMEKISDLGNLTFQEVHSVNKYDAIQYLTAWTILQRFYWTHYETKMSKNKSLLDIVDLDSYKELKKIQKECYRYSIFANGAYGSLSSYLFSELKGINRPEKQTDNTKEFISHTKLTEQDVLYSFWDATPYKPAYIIARDQKEKAIVLSIRGTNHWADTITDLDFHYLSFSIMREANSDRMFLKFHYNPETQEYLRKRLGDDTREFNGELSQPLIGNEVVIETGYAHAGMLVSAIGAYKEITSKLESILSKPEYSDYQLKITGHSLGGGMATLAVLLYIIHPLKAIKQKVQERLRGYSYGGAAVLSLDFDKYMQEVMKTVVLGYDIVPRLTYGSIRDLCKIILVFDEIKAKDPDIISQVLWLEVTGGDLSKLQNEEKSRTLKLIGLYEHFKQKHMDSLKLFPMGRVFHIQDFRTEPIKRSGNNYEFVVREIKQKEFFDEISFSRSVIKHHFADGYEGCLSSDKLLYQKYLGKPINKNEGLATSKSEIKPYTK